MKTRVITAVVALAIFIPIILLGGFWIELAAMVLSIIAVGEIGLMKKRFAVSFEMMIAALGTLSIVVSSKYLSFLPKSFNNNALFLTFMFILLIYTVVTHNNFSFDGAGILTLGMIYVGVGFHYLVQARSVGLTTLLYLLLIVWSTDSGAYLIGRKIGQHKFAPRLSPNKTWEGSLGGIIVAVIISLIWILIFPQKYGIFSMLFLTVILSIGDELGDLIESALKRFYGVKDSGKILPGHGGILDRFDSLLLVLPLAHLFGLI